MRLTPLLLALALCAGAADSRFQALGTNYSVGQADDHVIAPGPTAGSQRLYLDYTYVSGSIDLVAVDPDTGNFQVFPSPAKSEYSGKQMVVGPGGALYMGTAPNAHVFRLDPASGQYTDLGRPSATEQYIWGLALGSDGKIYGCTYPSAKLVRVDPATGAGEDLGRMDPTELYARFIAASSDGFIYAAIGYGQQHLVAYEIASGTHRDILPGQDQVTGVANVWRGSDGNVYGTGGGHTYRLSGFTATAIASSAAKPAAPWNVFADGRTIAVGDGIIRVTDPASHQTTTLPYTYTGQQLAVFRVGLGPDGMLYGSTVLPFNLVASDPAQGGITTLGALGGGEAYSLMPYNGRLLIAGYGALAPLMSYDPLAGFSPAANGNPVLVHYSGEDSGWRPQSMVAGPRGRIYIGATAGYGKITGPLTVWDPASNQVASYVLYPDQSVISVTPAGDYIAGATSIEGGGGSHPTATQAYLFLWDPATQQKVYETVPVPGAPSIANLATAPDGNVFGIAGRTWFVFDPQARQVTSMAGLPFSGVLPGTLAPGPDGNLWGLTSSGIFTINPQTRQAAMVAQAPQPISAGFAMDAGNIYYASGATLYRYLWAPFAVVSAASAYAALAPGSYGSIYGADPADSPTVTIRDAAGTDHTCDVISVSSGQINFVVPADVAPGLGSVTVAGASAPIQINAVAPGLFPSAQVLRIAADGTQSVETVAGPITVGSSGERVYLMLYGTGIRNRSALTAVKARIGTTELPVLYAGPQGEYAALDQVNVQLPRSLAGSGNVRLKLFVDGISANPAPLVIR